MANTKVTGDLIASSTIATGNIADNAVTSDKISGITTAHITEGSNLYYTDARADARITAATTSDLTEGTNLYYTDARADARAALLVDSAPSTLDTLNELAAALGDDPNFATTTANSIGLKAPLASPSFTGNATFAGSVTINNNTPLIVNGTDPLISFQNSATNHWQVGLENTNSDRFVFYDNNAAAYQLILNSTSGNATFAGSVLSPRYNINTSSMSIISESNRMKFTNAIANNAGGFDFFTRNSGSTYINALQILGTGNATFAGEISSGDDINVVNGKLTVNTTSAEVRIKSTSDTGESFINFADPSDNNVGQIYYGHGTNKMSIRVNDATRLAITSGGDIEVEGGDLFLNSGTNYNDKGVVYFSNERTAIISDIVNATANGDTSLDFQTRKGGARASAMFIDEFRNVGIGTTSTSQKLDVAGNIRIRGTNQGILLDTTGADQAARVLVENDYELGVSTNRGSAGFGVFGNSNIRLGFGTSHTLAQTSLLINSSGDVGIGTTTPSQKLDVQGNVNINGTIVEEGSGSNKTYRYRTPNSSSYSGGNALITFGRFYWTPAHWVSDGPVLEVTLQCKYYSGYQRKYIIKAGYGDNEAIINELQPSQTEQKITLQVGTKTAAGYNYAGQPVYYVDLQWTQTAYIWGWAQLSVQVPFLTSNPTSGWGGVVVYSALGQNNNAGTPTNHASFFAGNIKVPSTYNLTTGTAANMHVDSNGFFYRSTSSLKYKTDVRDYDKGLNEIMQLQPKYYKGKDDGNVQFAGLIAEDVHDLGLTEFVQYADDETPDALAYPNMIALLTKAIQELKEDNDSLKTRIETLEN